MISIHHNTPFFDLAEKTGETAEKSINSKELIAFLKSTAGVLSINSERLAKDGKASSAHLDESIAIYIRECLIDELADNFDIDIA